MFTKIETVFSVRKCKLLKNRTRYFIELDSNEWHSECNENVNDEDIDNKSMKRPTNSNTPWRKCIKYMNTKKKYLSDMISENDI